MSTKNVCLILKSIAVIILHIFQCLQLDDTLEFRRILTMDRRTYGYLLQRVGPLIEKEDTQMRRAIPPSERLAVTMWYLATGKIVKFPLHR